MIKQRLGQLLATAVSASAAFIVGLTRKQLVAGFFVAVAVVLTGFMLLTAGWEHPPINSVQSGYRGGGQATLYSPSDMARQLAENPVPVAPVAADMGGPRASEVYQNIKVLGNLSAGQFIRLMQGMTEWLAPEQGCSYCHANGNFASDARYTKRVARRMIQMTRQINTHWSKHVAKVGVTCYTCHRGLHVPAQSWVDTDQDKATEGMVVADNGQPPNKGMGFFASLPSDSYSALLDKHGQIRVQGDTALPTGNRSSIQQGERTFALMIHMSNALGVNCAFCHNSRNFGGKSSTYPHQLRALYGIHMVRDINNHYISPLAPIFPPERKVNGKVYKVNCASCHQGVYKPLYGARMVANYPELAVPDNPKPSYMMPSNTPMPKGRRKPPARPVKPPKPGNRQVRTAEDASGARSTAGPTDQAMKMLSAGSGARKGG